MVVSTRTRTLTFTRTISAAPSVVYRAFTKAMAVREWLSDSAYLGQLPAPGAVHHQLRTAHARSLRADARGSEGGKRIAADDANGWGYA
jgi:uncharacterized protein YndB with AHSA1/START domain